MEAGLMKKGQSVNRSWTPDSYFSEFSLFIGEESRGKCPGDCLDTATRGHRFPVCPRAQNTPATPLTGVGVAPLRR